MPNRSLEDIDWNHWVPTEWATVLYVIHEWKILLIRKKRGIGAGKINAPGGRIEKGESGLACAVRETEEETGITPCNVQEGGELCFHFVTGFSMKVTVFTANAFQGAIHETEEALPIWYTINKIPYDEMWAADRLWLPAVVEGNIPRGRVLYDGDKILDHTFVFSRRD